MTYLDYPTILTQEPTIDDLVDLENEVQDLSDYSEGRFDGFIGERFRKPESLPYLLGYVWATYRKATEVQGESEEF